MDTNNNTIIYGILAVIAVALVTGMFTDSEKTIQLVNSADDQKTITVSETAERLVPPDTAKVSFSMTRKDVSLTAATDSVNSRIGEMVSQLASEGVKEKDIKTTNYNVYPEYTYARASGERAFDGYRVNQSVELIIRDLDQVSAIMTKVAAFEVDNVSGLQFYIDDDEALRAELREEAIDAAKAKAKVLGKSLGVSLDTIVGFNEGGNKNFNQPVYARAMSMDFAEESVASAVVPAGENKLTATVSITFEISN